MRECGFSCDSPPTSSLRMSRGSPACVLFSPAWHSNIFVSPITVIPVSFWGKISRKTQSRALTTRFCEFGHARPSLSEAEWPWPSLKSSSLLGYRRVSRKSSQTQENVSFSHQKLIWDKKHFQSLHKRWLCPQMLPRQGTILEAKNKTSSSTSAMN